MHHFTKFLIIFSLILSGGGLLADEALIEELKENAVAFEEIDDLAPLIEKMAERRFALLGEMSHGTHEFYAWRGEISKRLIADHGFRFVAVEGDWADLQRVNRYVLGLDDQFGSAREALVDYNRWPEWLWANQEFGEFVEWLKEFNAQREMTDRVGVYGMDMQDPMDAMEGIFAWLHENEDVSAQEIQAAYRCLWQYRADIMDYPRMLSRGGTASCEEDVRRVVELLRERYATESGRELWYVKQGAKAVKSAESRFRAMLTQGPESWNVRARYMGEIVAGLSEKFNGPGIVWAHNTHIGDSGATDMVQRGEVNIGRLLRESNGGDSVFALGMITVAGKVQAGANWGEQRQVMTITGPRRGSHDAMFGAVEQNRFYVMTENLENSGWRQPRQQRAIGVIYRPPNEAYVMTVLPDRYEAVLFFRETSEVTPLPGIP